MVELLLTKDGIDVDSKDGNGWSPLFWAAEYGPEAVVKLLLDNKADADAEDNCGWTALQLVAFNPHEQIEQLLVKNRALMPKDFLRTPALFLREQ